MAQSQRDLTYPCSKVVMEHMGANDRYLLAACCPDLRNTHTQVPLKIDHLILDTNGFTVDNIPHTLHTFVSNLNQIPRDWGIEVPSRGLTHDIDRFGFPHVDDAIEGDIVIQQWLVDYQASLRRFPPGGFGREPPSLEQRDTYVARTRREKDRREMERARRARMRARVHTYLQYTYFTPVRYPRGIQLAEALRKLMGNFFAASKIFVNVMEIAFPFGVLRFPRDLRFHVVSLKTGRCSAEVLNAISPIIIGDPLQALEITVREEDDPIFDHEILRTIPCLSIRLPSSEDWATTLTRMQVPIVKILDDYTCVELIESVGNHWIEYLREVGFKMMFEAPDNGYVFDNVQHELGTAKGILLPGNLPPEFPLCGFKKVNMEREFVVYVQKEDQNDERSKWFIVLEMMEVGSVREIKQEIVEPEDF